MTLVNANKRIAILGTRGIPSGHGGFETFAEYLATYLKRNGWDVTVYCQKIGKGPPKVRRWLDIELVEIYVGKDTALHTILFDWKSVWHSRRHHSLILTLGYNTGFLNLIYRLSGVRNIINMDGLEWKRAKWSLPVKIWFYINERLACWFGNHLIADHPEIQRHLETRISSDKITMIPYGADSIENCEPNILSEFGLTPKEYALMISRIEPENSTLEIVSAFSAKSRGYKLVVLGRLDPDASAYHGNIVRCASKEVLFLGAIYDKTKVRALRFFSRLYIHGHQVGGTNPSLVEALGAGSPVLAHDNRFNRWVTRNEMLYFKTSDECGAILDRLLTDDERLTQMSLGGRQIHHALFEWEFILKSYETLLSDKGSPHKIITGTHE
jgi:glycosyltransferase involved in cell wall biosynthesis